MKKPPLAHYLDRRKFLGNSLGGVGLTGLLGGFAALRPINRALGQTPVNDYKALVCLYLNGGNDGANTIVPMGAEHAEYASYRGVTATIPQDQLYPIPAVPDGRTFGLHPALGSIDPAERTLHSLYGEGKLALIGNVGPLVVPTTKQQFRDESVPLPPQLYSHRDQTIHWQSAVPDRPFTSGWGGRLADLTYGSNGDAELSISISLGGVNNFLVSTLGATQPYRMGTKGYVPFGILNQSYPQKLRILDATMGAPHDNLHSETYRQMFVKARETNALLGTALENLTLPANYPEFGTDVLSGQLAMIAKMIAVREQLGMKRQIFYCTLAGFDTHRNHLAKHDELWTSVNNALVTFYEATEALGVENDVTSFTSSEFGRTYTPNGTTVDDGVDHAWGSHAMVLGGAVNGGLMYGKMPIQTPGGPDDVNIGTDSRGYLIPTTSVDEFSGTLAKWYGLDSAQLAQAFPNLHRFPNPDLGFMS